jgi:hypothetical protein
MVSCLPSFGPPVDKGREEEREGDSLVTVRRVPVSRIVEEKVEST